MTSVLSHYAQTDTRQEAVILTGYITQNGAAAVSPPQVDRPAYGEINLQVSKTFTLDARPLTIRNDDPLHPSVYLINLYLSSTKLIPNYEFDLVLTPPLKGGGDPGTGLLFKIFANKTDAYNNTNPIFQFINIVSIAANPPYIFQTPQLLTFKVVNNSLQLKILPIGLLPYFS
ncbi:MAG: hypothetical protein EBT07_09005 [Actinobacteria bacterium]|nr:hypothetical protein [Actinomycetota bacterium]